MLIYRIRFLNKSYWNAGKFVKIIMKLQNSQMKLVFGILKQILNLLKRN